MRPIERMVYRRAAKIFAHEPRPTPEGSELLKRVREQGGRRCRWHRCRAVSRTFASGAGPRETAATRDVAAVALRRSADLLQGTVGRAGGLAKCPGKLLIIGTGPMEADLKATG